MPPRRRIHTYLIIILCLAISAGCRLLSTTQSPDPELIDQDYYFYDGQVQIQGRATLPGARESVSAPTADGNTKTVVRFLTLGERRQRCRQKALQNSHAKWLSLTDRDWQQQSEWRLRLDMGAAGSWRHCLDEARIRAYFYDGPEQCRVVAIYGCRPQDY